MLGSSTPTGFCDGCKILVVEDDFFVGKSMMLALIGFGATAVGPIATVARSLEAIRNEGPFDLVILDVNLGNERSYDVAIVADGLNIPVLLCTGYDVSDLPAHIGKLPRVPKPFTRGMLLKKLNEVLPTQVFARS